MSTTVPIFDPQGQVREIPLDQKDAALKAGGKVAIKMTAPDKSVRWVPSDEYQQAIKAGGRPVPLNQQAPKVQSGPVSRFLQSALPVIPQAVKGAFEAISTPPQGTLENIISGLGPPALPAYRAIIAPAIEQGKQAVSEFKEAGKESPWYSFRPSPEATGHREQAVAHALAAMLPGVGPWAATVGEKTGEQVASGDIAGAGGTLAGNVALAAAPKIIGETKSAISGGLKRSVGPVEVTIEGEKVPVLRSEAFPGTRGANLTESVKKSGVGAPKFKAFADKQQAAVRRVIQNVARKTAGVQGWAPAEASASLDAAANTIFAKAKPMYQALDASLTTIPDTLTHVSRIMSDAIAKAKKLGVNIESGPTAGGTHFQGAAVGDVVGGQPLTGYIQVRSELLKAQRAAIKANNGALANAIENEVSHMNGQIEAALHGTPLYQNWLDANKLWAQGHAVSDTAYELFQATKGTPEAAQSPMLGRVPTKIQGPSLVDRLNTLERDGTLDRGFTPQQRSNLRQAVDILDRARDKAGSDTSMLPGHTYSVHSFLWRTILRLPAVPLVRAMTTTEGMRALSEASKATTATAIRRALIPIVAGSATKRSDQ